MNQEKKQKLNTIFIEVNECYRNLNISDVSDYLLTLLFLCIYRDEVVERNRNENHFINRALFYKDSERKDPLYQIFESFPELNKLTAQELRMIFGSFSQLDHQFYKNHFEEIFEYYFEKITGSISYVEGAFIAHPKLIKLILKNINVEKLKSVYNPLAANAELAVSLNDPIQYFGQEYNLKIWRAGYLRLYAYNLLDNYKFRNESCIEIWPYDEKYDLILSKLPFLRKIEFNIGGNATTIEEFVMLNSVDLLKPNGKAVFILPSSYLSGYDSKTKMLLKKLVNRNLIEKIMYFPNGVFNNIMVDVNVLVLNKEKTHNNIDLIDFTEVINRFKIEKELVEWHKVTTKRLLNFTPKISTISSDDIKEGGYNLSASFLIATEFIKSIKDGEPLENLVDFVSGEKIKDKVNAIKIGITDLAENEFSSQKLNLDDKTKVIIDPNENSEFNLINESGILISILGRKPRLIYYDAKEEIVVPDEIILIKIKKPEKLSYGYLLYKLRNEMTMKQFDALAGSSVFRRISKKSLASVRIEIKPIEEREDELADYQHKLIEEAHTDYKEKIKSIDAEVKEANNLLRHKIAAPVSNLPFYANNIKEILEIKILPEFSQIFELKKDENQILNLGENLDKLIQYSDLILREVRNQTQVSDIDKYDLSEIEILSWLQKYIGNETSKYPDIKFEHNLATYFEDNLQPDFVELSKLKINGNDDLLNHLFNNLMENIQLHAFNGKADKKIKIQANYNIQNKHLSILISNTGNPFPDNLNIDDFGKRGIKAGSSGRSGFGGYLISNIIKHFKGTYEIIKHSDNSGLLDDDFVTTFEITLPIYL